MRRREYLCLSGTSLVGGLAGCAKRTIGRTKSVTVSMTNDLAFEPATVTIQADTAILWKNVSDVSHTVTAYEDSLPQAVSYFGSGAFPSEKAARNNVQQALINPGEAYKHAFRRHGTYEYFCIVHEEKGMKGTVIVNP